MGSPTYYGLMSAKLKAFIDQSVGVNGKLAGKVGGAFTSSGGTATGAETTLISIDQALLIHGMIVQGGPSGSYYGVAAQGKPSEEGLEACEELGKRVAALALKLQPC